MFDSFQKLKDDIQSSVDLKEEATGFFSCVCPMCNANRVTGGFKFEHDAIIYNCFRGSCDSNCVLKVGEPVSRKFKFLMNRIGVAIPTDITLTKKVSETKSESHDEDLYKENTYHAISKLKFSDKLLIDSRNDMTNYWLDYLESRVISHDNFYMVDKGMYKNCIVYPIRLHGKIIANQVLTKNGIVTLTDRNRHVIFSPSKRLNNKILLVEGFMDALSLPSITTASFNPKISREQAFHLKGKDVIMLPDRDRGNHYIEQFSRYGWKIALPEWDCKDLNEAVIKYGKFVAMQMIMDSIYEDKFTANVAYKMWRD